MKLHELRLLIETAGDRTVAEVEYLAAARSRSLPEYAAERWQRQERQGRAKP